MKAFRDRLEDFARAPWLRRIWLYRLVYTFAIMFDGLVDWVVYAIQTRYPETAPPDALPVLGRERGIWRGFAETDTSYASRLVVWLLSRKFRGNAFALMDQLAGYMTGYAVVIRVVNLNGAWYTRLADGTREYHRATPSNWNWDSYTTQWSRYWVIIYPPIDLWIDEGYFDSDEYVGDGGQIGATLTQDQADTLRAIVLSWNPPHANPAYLILALDSESFDPTGAPGAPLPTTDWETWADYDGSLNAYSTRLDTGRYCTGIDP